MADGVIGTAIIKVKPDTRDFSKELNGSTKSALTGFATAVGTAFAVQKVVQFGKSVIDAASDTQESLSKSKAVFGDLSGQVQDWSRTSAESFGLSSQAALEAAATFGNLFTAMGIARQPALEMSESIVQLAADLASFNNTSVDDALVALKSGLVGETEPLRRFGVNLNQAALEAKAMALGLWDGEGALSAAAKAQAAYALIMEQTTTAQGDFARTSDGLANQQRILAAKFGDLQAALGQALLPTMQIVVGALGGMLDTFMALPGPVQATVLGLAAVAGGGIALGKVIGAVSESFGTLRTVMASAGAAAPWLAAVAAVATVAVGVFTQLANEKKRTAQAAGELAKALTNEKGALDSTLLYDTVSERLGGFAQQLSAAGVNMEELTRFIETGVRTGGMLSDKYQDLVNSNSDYNEALNLTRYSVAEVVAQQLASARTSEQVTDAENEKIEATLRGARAAEEQRLAQEALRNGSELSAETTERYRAKTEELVQKWRDGKLSAEDLLTSGVNLSSAISLVADVTGQATKATEGSTAATQSDTQAKKDLKAAVDEQNKAMQTAIDKANALAQAQMESFSSSLAFENQTARTDEAIQKYSEAQAEAAKGGKDHAEKVKLQEQAARDAYGAFLNSAAAAVRMAEDNAKATGAAFSNKDAIRVQIGELERIAGTLAPDSPLRARLLGYIENLKGAERNVTATVTADTSSANSQIIALNGKIVKVSVSGDFSAFDRAMKQRAVGYAGLGAGGSYDSGGIIPGALGAPRGITAHGGEVVLNPRQQAQLLWNMANGKAEGGGPGGPAIHIENATFSTELDVESVARAAGYVTAGRWAA